MRPDESYVNVVFNPSGLVTLLRFPEASYSLAVVFPRWLVTLFSNPTFVAGGAGVEVVVQYLKVVTPASRSAIVFSCPVW
jgi:hypothetical protein